jgi:clan AA aspartic protease (TIGR02281 family)
MVSKKRKMNRSGQMIFALAISFICLCFPGGVFSEFYKYIDKNGNVHFADALHQIPPEYRDQLDVYEGAEDHLSKEEKQTALKEEDETMETDVVIRGNNVLIPVQLGYGEKEIEVVMVLDTGASIVAINHEIADQLGIKEVQKGSARVVGGQEINFNTAKLSYVRVGNFQKNDLLTGIIDHQGKSAPFNGLLGMNFLQHFEYDIDFEKQVVRWKPKGDLD